MYLILSRQNSFEFTVAGKEETIEAAQAIVAELIEECGKYADRLHPEAFQIVQVIEAHGGPKG